MKLSAAFSVAIKYGKADSEGIKNWLNQADNTDVITDDLSHPDNFFADWLQDREDPRHQIVRKDLEIRKDPASSWGAKLNNTERKLIGQLIDTGRYTDITFPENIKSDVSAAPKYGTKGLAYRVVWFPKEKASAAPYSSYFTPEEFQNLLSEFGGHQKIEDFQ